MTSAHRRLSLPEDTQKSKKCKIFIISFHVSISGEQDEFLNTRVKLFVGWQMNSRLSHASWQDKGNAVLWLRPPPIKSRECEDPSWVGFWVFSCANLDSVQKFLDWHLEYFSLSTDSDFNQNSTMSKLAQNKTKPKSKKNLVPKHPPHTLS